MNPMPQKRNKTTLRDIETRDEQYWFSIIKDLAEDAEFGTVSLSLTVKNGEITNIQYTEIKKNFNIKS